ncbi:MAG: zinc dependent phospholipase C family protein, partial [Bdellovibrionales bacterium]|nr:zinc dependent phospholipase C family protein [Bdellovibrionales bacterium]
MPAEIVHWEILNSICSAENTNPNAKKILLEFPECAALGALGHDAPYFFNAGTSAATSKSCSFLHGAFGDDPLVFLYHALTIAKEKKLKPAEAFVLGMITHYAADSCFHPLVYYLTGNYYSSDIEEQKLVKTRHRRFEVFLDTWWKYNFDSSCHDPKILLKKANKHLAEIGEVLSIALSRSSDKFEISAKNWEKSIRHLVFICKLTTNPFIGILMKFFNFISLGKLD